MLQLNLKTYFGDDLHDYPENPEDIKKFVEIERHEIQLLNGDEKYKRMSHLAVRYRQLKNYEEAHELFKIVHSYFNNHNPQMEMVNYLRWSDVFRFEKRSDEAWIILEKVEEILFKQQFKEYQDFYLQHLGKFYFDKCEYKKAYECFEKALIIRLKKGNTELSSSSEFALKIAKQKTNSF